MHFSLNQNNVNDYITLCVRQNLASLKCMHRIMLCPTITLSLAMPLLMVHLKATIKVISLQSCSDTLQQ